MAYFLASDVTDADTAELEKNVTLLKMLAKENEIDDKTVEIELMEKDVMLKKKERALLKRELTVLRQELKREEKKVENAEKKKAKEAAKNDKKNIVEAEPEANLKNLEKENVNVKAIQLRASTKSIVVNSSQVFYFGNDDGAEAEKSISFDSGS